MIWLYRLFYLPGLLLALPYYLFRMWRRGGYGKDFQHRLGRFRKLPPPAAGTKRIWLQAVSVGEVLAVGPLIDALQADGRTEIVLTTTTSTGYAEARKRYQDSVFALGIFPLDFWLFSRMAWRRIRPQAIILTESELWPEHLHQTKRRGIPAFLVNARMSDRSFRRYAKFPKLTQRVLDKFTAIYPASETDQDRLRELGASREKLHANGSIKLDAPLPAKLSAEDKKDLLQTLGFSEGEKTEPIILLGSSTWPGEESALIRIVSNLLHAGTDCRLLLVPRHAERGPDVRRELEQQPRAWHQRSTGVTPDSPVYLHLADTTGELAQFTQIADIAFVGKSLPPNEGGQSPVDAAGLGVPLLFGPNMNNFKDIARMLQATGAAIAVGNADSLEKQVHLLIKDPARREQMSQAGRKWHEQNRGSSRRIAESISTLLKDSP